jgi:hypothetical protein
MEKQFTFRFYDISREKEEIPSMVDMLRQVAAEPDKEKRQARLAQDYIIRLENLEEDGADAVVGEFTRCQGTNFPAELDGSARKALTAKRLGHSIVFRYNHKTGIIGIQYDARVISPGRILEYLSSYNPSAIYKMEPRINADAWKKFSEGQTRKLVVRISNPSDLQALEGPNQSVSQGLKAMANAYDAPSIQIEISMGHRKGFLSNAVQGLADSLSKLTGASASVEKMSAVTVIDDTSETIDLIEDRVALKDTLGIDDRDPEKNYQVKKSYLCVEMKKMFG